MHRLSQPPLGAFFTSFTTEATLPLNKARPTHNPHHPSLIILPCHRWGTHLANITMRIWGMSLLAAVAAATTSATTSPKTPVPWSGPPPPVCAGSVANETDIVGGKILAKVLTPDNAACCRRCFSSGDFPTADAWVRENQTVGNCWCVENAHGTKHAPSRTVGQRATPPPPMPGPQPPPAVLEACEAAATLDPRGTRRKPGGSFEHVAMAANSTASDCTALCCLDWNCVAFSFDTVATICSLMDELAPIANTSDPLSVVTGFLAKLDAPSPPFPQSTKFHSNVTFKSEMYFGTEGDSWPTTWLQDNTQLTAAGDRGDFGTHMSMWRVNGSAPTTVGDDIPMQPVGSVVCANFDIFWTLFHAFLSSLPPYTRL